MGIKIGLLRFLLWKTSSTTMIGNVIVWLYVLISPDVLEWREHTPPVIFILIHSLVLTVQLGRFRTGSVAFLYTRGYSRDGLWAHTMLAAFVAVLIVWGQGALLVWTPARSLVQDKIYGSPYFPIMAAREAITPWLWLLAYAVLVPTFHYACVRLAQPSRGRSNGVFVAAGLIAGAFSVMVLDYYRAAWFAYLCVASCLVVAAVMLAAGRKLHQRLEVGV